MLAIYKKLNYLAQCSDEIFDGLLLFRKVDNSNMYGVARFMSGYTESIQFSDVKEIDDRAALKLVLTRFKRLKKWN